MKLLMQVATALSLLLLVGFSTAATCQGCSYDELGSFCATTFIGYGSCHEVRDVDSNGTLTHSSCRPDGDQCSPYREALLPDGTTLDSRAALRASRGDWKRVTDGEMALFGCRGQLVGYRMLPSRASEVRSAIGELTL
jgi:hypothetical protein